MVPLSLESLLISKPKFNKFLLAESDNWKFYPEYLPAPYYHKIPSLRKLTPLIPNHLLIIWVP